MANAVSISSKTKHIYYADVADEAGNRQKIMTGVITFTSAGPSTDDMNPNFTADIPTLDFVSIEGEDGYVAQYEYTTADIKILVQGTASEAGTALTVTTAGSLTGLKFRYMVWGY
jgi:hypothetical protein